MLEDAHRIQLDEIAFVLKDRSKPTLVLIVVGSYRLREELRVELARLLPGSRSARLDLSGRSITSLFRTIGEQAPPVVLHSRPGEYLLHIDGIEESLLLSRAGTLAASPLIEELNLERENLFHGFPCSLILWTTPHFADKLMRDAPDLWDWLGYHFQFADPRGDATSDPVPPPSPDPDGVSEERLARIAELEAKLRSLALDGVAPERLLRSQLSLHKILGAEYLAAFQPGKAIRSYTAALALLGQMEHARFEEAGILFRLGSASLAARRFAEALNACQQSLRIQEEEGAEHNMGATWHQIGMVYQKQRQWPQALESYQKALEWNEKTGQPHELGGTWHQIGMVYEKQRQWPQALESYQKALEWKEKTGQPHQLGNTWHQIGRVYEEQRQWPQALESYQKALEWKEKTGQPHQLGSTWHQIGMVYQKQRQWSQALESYQKALEWDEKTGQAHQLGGTWHQIGRVYEEQRQWPQALESYQKALEWKEKTGQPHQLGSTWHQIGMVHEAQEDWAEAGRCYRQALELCLRTGMDQHCEVVQNSLQRILPSLSEQEKESLLQDLPPELRPAE